MRSPIKVAAILAFGALMTASCGARLSSSQMHDALNAGAGGGSSSGSATGGTGGATTGATTPGGTTTGSTTPGGTTTGAVTPGGSTTGASTTGTGSTGKTTGGTTGASTTGGKTTGATTGSTTGSTNFQAAPAGGNGGKTDTGITSTEINISNISDISGAVPGLFQDARFAVQAYVKYFTARYGTIYGRKLVLKTYDSQLDSGVARSDAIDACANSFAGVGSVSAFDQGAAQPEQSCGIPDIRGLATTDEIKAVPNVYPAQPAGKGGERGLGVFGWAKQYFPSQIKKSGYIYVDGAVTEEQEQQDIQATEATLGYKFIATEAVPITETNFEPYIADLKSKGVQFVTFTGAESQAAQFAKGFAADSYAPIFEPTVTAYSPDFISQAGPAAEGVYVAVAPSIVEEINGNTALETYDQWLQQVSPGATPTAIGEYAWGAAALFVKEAIAVGPHLTRKALLAKVAAEHGFTADGMYPATDVGGRRLSDCTIIVKVQGGKFTRFEPKQAQTHRCVDGVYDTKTKQFEKGFPQ